MIVAIERKTMMSEYRIQNQIALYMTNKKLCEFNSKLQAAPVEFYGHVHAPVSYTHLDVYKRQNMPNSRQIWKLAGRL